MATHMSMETLVGEINRTLDAVSDLCISKIEQGQRKEALKLARTLTRKLEGPRETAFRHAFESHNRSLCLRLAVDLRLFHTLNRLGIATGQELARDCDAEERLVVRIMRLLSAEGYAEEIAEWTWSPTGLSKAMTDVSLEACVVHSFDTTARVQSHLPEYFRRVGYQCTTSHGDGPFQYGMQTDLSFFDFLHAHPERALTFDAYMTGNRSTRKHWLEWFPFRKEVLDPWIQGTRQDDDSVLLVDMAGGRGRDVTLLTQRFPEAKSHVVLQDLAGTLQDSKVDRGSISVCAHDIFASQPITGAEIYYTHFVLHDFSDERCIIMLNHVKAAMRPHSRILLNEIVLPERDCPSFFAAADITMMTNLSALARSEKQWRHLIESVGLDVIRIWKSPDAEDWEAVIEVR